MTSPVRSQGRTGLYCSQACAAKSRWLAADYDSPVTIARRFWSKVDKNGPDQPEIGACWIWTSTLISQGYGQFWLEGGYRPAAQVALFLESGSWPGPGLFVLHRCDFPPCVRPSHLFVGTPLDNMRDMAAKGRHRGPNSTHCAAGHPREEANTTYTKAGTPRCLTCQRAYRKGRAA